MIYYLKFEFFKKIEQYPQDIPKNLYATYMHMIEKNFMFLQATYFQK